MEDHSILLKHTCLSDTTITPLNTSKTATKPYSTSLMIRV